MKTVAKSVIYCLYAMAAAEQTEFFTVKTTNVIKSNKFNPN